MDRTILTCSNLLVSGWGWSPINFRNMHKMHTHERERHTSDRKAVPVGFDWHSQEALVDDIVTLQRHVTVNCASQTTNATCRGCRALTRKGVNMCRYDARSRLFRLLTKQLNLRWWLHCYLFRLRSAAAFTYDFATADCLFASVRNKNERFVRQLRSTCSSGTTHTMQNRQNRRLRLLKAVPTPSFILSNRYRESKWLLTEAGSPNVFSSCCLAPFLI